MRLSETLIERLNDALGVTGQPHLDGEWQFTEAMEWRLPRTSSEPAVPEISQELKDAVEMITARLKSEDFHDKKGMFELEQYSARFRVIFQDEMSHLEAELAELGPKLEALQDYHQQPLARGARMLANARKMIEGEQAVAYRAWINAIGSVPSPEEDKIVVAPTKDQFDILRIEQTNGANYGLTPDDVIAKLQELDQRFGIEIIGATMGGLDFRLKRIPDGNEARELGEWLLDFCPELYEVPESFPDGLVSLWWD